MAEQTDVTATISLGRLAPVPVRSVGPHEARHLTPWLADNLDALGEALGMELQLEAVERAVGPFRADILARDARGDDDALVLIENQFGITDHDHAGKLLTYAAGLRPRTVIWVAETFRDEHRAYGRRRSRRSANGIARWASQRSESSVAQGASAAHEANMNPGEIQCPHVELTSSFVGPSANRNHPQMRCVSPSISAS